MKYEIKQNRCKHNSKSSHDRIISFSDFSLLQTTNHSLIFNHHSSLYRLDSVSTFAHNYRFNLTGEKEMKLNRNLKLGIIVAVLGVIIESLLFQTISINLKNIFIDFTAGSSASFIASKLLK